MKILLCGGSQVGKSSFLHRLTENSVMPQKPLPSKNSVCNSVISFSFSDKTKITLHLWEVGNSLSSSPQFTCDNYFCDADAAILVIDAGSVQSLKDVDSWLRLLKSSDKACLIPKILVVNKADCINHVISSKKLDQFVKAANIDDWYYTVGNAAFCDFDHRRGNLLKQSTASDILRKMIALISHHTVEPYGTTGKINTESFPSVQPTIKLESQYSMASFQLFDKDVGSKLHATKTSRIEVYRTYPEFLTTEEYFCLSMTKNKQNSTTPNRKKDLEDSWQSFSISISREQSEEVLLGFREGTFLIRKCFPNNEFRISIKTSKNVITHTPFKWYRESGTFRCGRTELRGVDFKTFCDMLKGLQLQKCHCLLLL